MMRDTHSKLGFIVNEQYMHQRTNINISTAKLGCEAASDAQ